jgi:hypothetical protein
MSEAIMPATGAWPTPWTGGHSAPSPQLANRRAGILHIRLQRGQPYDETAAWQHLETAAA